MTNKIIKHDLQKKGFVFTLIVTLLGIGLLTLVIILSSSNTSYEARLNELSAFESLNNLDQSLQRSLRQIFLEKSLINVTVIKWNVGSNIYWNVSFVERLPNLHIDFNRTMGDFNTSIRNNFTVYSSISCITPPSCPRYAYAEVNAQKIIDDLELVITSHDITYKHSNARANVISVNSLTNTVVPNDYEFFIIANNVITTTGSIITHSTISLGSFRVVIKVWDKLPPDRIKFEEKVFLLNPNQLNEFVVAFTDNANDKLNIRIFNPANVEVSLGQPTSYQPELNTTIVLPDNNNLVEVKYPQGIINITQPGSGIKRLGYVKII